MDPNNPIVRLSPNDNIDIVHEIPKNYLVQCIVLKHAIEGSICMVLTLLFIGLIYIDTDVGDQGDDAWPIPIRDKYLSQVRIIPVKSVYREF